MLSCLIWSITFIGCLDKESPVTDTTTGSSVSSFAGATGASNTDGVHVRITWTGDSSSKLSVYRIYMVGSSGSLTQVGTASKTAQSVTVGGLTPCTLYTFLVRAIYTDGSDDGNYSTVSALTFAGATSATSVSSTSMTLNYAACTSASSFNVYCTDTAGNTTLFGSGTGSSSTTITGLTATKYYSCSVKALSGTGVEDSNTASVATATCYARPSSVVSIWDGDTVTGTTVTDQIGSNTGTMTASTSTSTSGKVSSAFSMSATNGGVSVASAASLNPTAGLSTGAWVYPSSSVPATTQTVISKGDQASSLAIGDFTYYNAGNVDGNNNTGAYGGAIFDGRYIYMVPYFGGSADSGKVVRYDTRSSLSSNLSYEVFDMTALSASAVSYIGGTYDGRYVYFTPGYKASNSAGNSLAVRYDTQGSFTSSSSWTTFDISTVNATYVGFNGAVYDGSRYVYFGGGYKTGPSGTWVRYDTQGAGFTSTSSWTGYVPFATVPFYSIGYDGRYVYGVPYSGYSSLLYRYDTRLSFTSAGSWTSTNVGHGANNLAGMAFDGRYMYFGAYFTTSIYRYDTTASYTAAGSWTSFDTAGLLAGQTGFWGMQFDGRYLYAQAGWGAANNGTLFRYDTTATFTAAGSWSYTTYKNLDASNGINGQRGLVFDGRYLYGIPRISSLYGYNGHIYRYDTGSATNSFRMNSYFNSGDGYSSIVPLGPSVSIQTSAGFYQVFGSSLLSAAWNLLVGTWDGSTLKLYVNGSLSNSVSTSGTLTTNTKTLNIGNFAAGTSSLNGYIDEAFIGNSALSSSDVTSLYTTYPTYGFCKQ